MKFSPRDLAEHLLEGADDAVAGAGRGHGAPVTIGLAQEEGEGLLDFRGPAAHQVDVERRASDDALVEHASALLLHAGDRFLEAPA